MLDPENETLLYLEKRVVDHTGRFNGTSFTKEAMDATKSLEVKGWIQFGKIAPSTINGTATHWVHFTLAGWTRAMEVKQAKAIRGFQNRTWLTITEEEERKENDSKAE